MTFLNHFHQGGHPGARPERVRCTSAAVARLDRTSLARGRAVDDHRIEFSVRSGDSGGRSSETGAADRVGSLRTLPSEVAVPTGRNWKSLFFSVVDKHIPSKLVGAPKNKPPWLDKPLKVQIRQKHLAWKEYKRTRSVESLSNFRLIRNKVTKSLRLAEKRTFSHFTGTLGIPILLHLLGISGNMSSA